MSNSAIKQQEMKNDNFDKERLMRKWQLPEDVKGKLENIIEDAVHEDFKSQKIKIDSNYLNSNKQVYSMTSKNRDSAKNVNSVGFNFKSRVQPHDSTICVSEELDENLG